MSVGMPICNVQVQFDVAGMYLFSNTDKRLPKIRAIIKISLSATNNLHGTAIYSMQTFGSEALLLQMRVRRLSDRGCLDIFKDFRKFTKIFIMSEQYQNIAFDNHIIRFRDSDNAFLGDLLPHSVGLDWAFNSYNIDFIGFAQLQIINLCAPQIRQALQAALYCNYHPLLPDRRTIRK